MNDNTAPADVGEFDLVELSADIVSAYVSHNAVSPSDLTRLIADVHGALRALRSNEVPAVVEDLKPALAA